MSKKAELTGLADAIDEMSWMAEATDTLLNDVLRQYRAACEREGTDAAPSDGLAWTMGKLVTKAHEIREMAMALAYPNETDRIAA